MTHEPRSISLPRTEKHRTATKSPAEADPTVWEEAFATLDKLTFRRDGEEATNSPTAATEDALDLGPDAHMVGHPVSVKTPQLDTEFPSPKLALHLADQLKQLDQQRDRLTSLIESLNMASDGLTNR